MRQRISRSHHSHIQSLENRQLLSAAPAVAQAAPVAKGLSAEYFQYDFQNPLLTRTDPRIQFKWVNNKPDSTFGNTSFTARWTGEIIAPKTGTYTFAAPNDGGVQLVIDSHTLFDTASPIDKAKGTAALTAGSPVPITFEYRSPPVGPAPLQLRWNGPGTHGINVVPRSALRPAAAPTLPANHGLLGTYYRGSKFQTEVMQRIDPYIKYTWPGSITPDRVIKPGSRYSAIFTGQIEPSYSETYTFYTRSDDGVTLTINGQEIINDPHVHAARSNEGTITLVAGKKYDITLTYFQNNIEPASVKLHWSSASQKKEIVPNSALFSVAAPDAPTLSATGTTSTVNLVWNDVSGETGFIVQRSTDGANFTAIATPAQGVLAYTDITGIGAPQYSYRVIAVDGILDSNPSNIARVSNPSPPSYASETTIYGLTTNSSLVYSIDPTDGSATQIGSLSFGTSAAGRDPLNGDFYYTSTGSSTIELAEWNPVTGVNTLISPDIGVTGNVVRAAFRSDGAMFITAGNGNLFQVDPVAGAATAKGTIMDGTSGLPTSTGDMAFSPDGTLYLATGGLLYSIPASTVASSIGAASNIPATNIGTINAPSLQIAFGQNGVLFGTDDNGQLYTVDLTTANATPVGTPSGIGMGDLASVPLYADLSVTQSASALVRGSTGNYSFSVANGGPDSTNSPITLVDTLPAGISFVGGSGNGWSFSVSGQTVTMIYTPVLGTGVTAPAATINVAVASSAASSVTNQVVVSTGIFDGNTSNNTSSLTSSVTG